MLADTLMAMDKSAEAEQILTGLGKTATPETQTLLGIALARQNKLDQAKSIAGKITLPAMLTTACCSIPPASRPDRRQGRGRQSAHPLLRDDPAQPAGGSQEQCRPGQGSRLRRGHAGIRKGLEDRVQGQGIQVQWRQ